MNTAPWPYPRWVAHRGAGKLAPENTLAAFRVGASHGYRMFECDVKLSADGVPFLLHDATLERTTGAQGVAGERSWSVLSRLDAGRWHSAAYAGEAMPSFAAIAHYCLANRFMLNVEIKPTPGQERETGRVVAADAATLWQRTAPLPLLTSFQPEALAAARDAQPELPRALLLDKVNHDWLTLARDLGCVAVVFDHKLIDANVAQQTHAAGLHIAAYTVNEAAQAQRLRALNVATLITDAVDVFDPAS